MKDPKIYTTKDGCFQYCYIRYPKQMCGTMIPFKPHWSAVFLGDLTSEIFDTKAECLKWIEEWYDIGEGWPWSPSAA